MRMFIAAAAGGLALIGAGATTSPNTYGSTAIQRQETTLKLAQNQDTKQRGQQYNRQYNKQDTGKRKSWGGG